MASFTLKLGSLDLSSYTRVHPQDGWDPYGGGEWASPQFSDAPFAEGRPLLNIDAGNREMVWPLFLKTTGVAGTTFASTAQALSPLVYWRDGDASGTTATDSSGNGRTGTYGSGITLAQAGLLTGDASTSASFDNTANAKVTSSYNPFTGNVTFFGVANLTNFTGQVSLFGSSSNTNAPTLVLANGSGQPTWFSDVAAAAVTWTGGDFPAATNVFWVLTWDNSTKTSELWINGVSKGTKVSANAFNATPGNLQQGSYGTNAGWRGKQQEFGVVSGVMSAANIAALNTIFASGPGTTTAKDNLHSLVQQINREIANPTSSPLRVEWKDQGASNSTFYDVTFARWDPHFNYRLGEKAYADGAIRVWCQPPYGHTATERLIATAAGTAPGLMASLIGVASPLAGDVAPQLRVTVNTSGEAVGPAGRGVIIAAPKVAGYLPFISAASMTAHPSAVLLGASGAPGSQALFNQGPADTGPIARLGLGATMYAGRNRVFAAVLPRTYTSQAVWAGDTFRQPLGPTAVTSRPDGFRLLDLGVVNVPTSTPTTEIGLYGGQVVQTASDGFFAKPPYSGAQGSSVIGIAGVYVLPESNLQAVRDTAAKPMTRSFFGASGGATALIDSLIGDYAETWGRTSAGGGSVFYGVNGMHLYSNGDQIWGNITPVRDFRMRGIVHPFCTPAFGPGNGVVQLGITPKGVGQGEYLYAAMMTQNASLMALSVRSSGGGGHLATLVIASAAGFPLASTMNGLVIDLWRQDSKVTLNAQWATATGISYIPSAGMTATTVPVASTGVTDARIRTVGVPYVFANATIGISYLQYDELRNTPQPSEAYRFTSVSGDTPLRSPITGSGPNVDLTGAKIGPALNLGASHTGIVAIDWQLDGGPMSDPMGVEVRCRDRFTYAR